MSNPVLGKCTCPICSKVAEVREGANKKPYIVCEWCVTQIRTLSGAGAEFMRRLITAPTPTPAPGPTPPPAPVADKPPAPAKSGSALDLLAGS